MGPAGPSAPAVHLPVERLDAVLFDLDGVLTDTATVHFRVWSAVFDPVLAAAGQPPVTFADYLAHVDGRPRVDGAAALLAARGLVEADAGRLARQKDARFRQAVRDEGVAAFDDAVRLAARLRDLGVPVAVVSSSRHTGEVLAAAGLTGLFPVVVDGLEADRLALPGKPDPALFLHAADLLGVHPARAVVVEDAVAGVEAGRRGGFGLVVGVDRRGGRRSDLLGRGADVVVADLDALAWDAHAAGCRWWPSADAGPAPAGWLLDYVGVDPTTEGVRETLCTLGNGYLATRGAAPEETAGPVHYPGTYAAGVYDRARSRIHGHTHEDESLVNLPNWLPLRWRAGGGRWVSPDQPEVADHRQSLDLRAGVLHRRYRHVDRRGRATTVISRRLVSMAAPHLAATETTFIAENWSGTLHLRAGIDGRVANAQAVEDRLLNHRHLRPDGQGRVGPQILWLRMRTRQSRVGVGVATRTRVAGAGRGRRRVTAAIAHPQEEYAIEIRRGHPVRVEKVAAVYTSRDRAIVEPAAAARAAVARAGGFAELLAAHLESWRDLWDRGRVDLYADTGRPLLALHTFHVLATASPHLVGRDAGIGARGLHGEGYRGHVFWDELFVHRVLALHLPEVGRALLLYRHRRLDEARRAAAAAGHRGAMFPWQSGSDGREETPTELYNPRAGRWMPDRSANQRHVGLAVAYSAWQYYQASGDLDFMLGPGAELVLEIARFFADLAHPNPATGRYEITGVMGPDEFHDGYPDTETAGVANNAYTNVMTVWLLRRALEVVDLLRCRNCGELPDRLGIDAGELARWAEITTRMHVPFHDDGIISQFDGYDALAPFDVTGHAARYANIGRLDLILAADGDSPNRYQVGKQADVLMLLYLLSAEELRELLAGLGYPWPEGALRRTVDYYFARMSHGSTLSRVVHAWVHARTDRARSWECLTEALSADLHDTQGGTTREGVHLGAMAGTIDLAERCYLGLETRDDALWLNPRLPDETVRVRTTLSYRGHRLQIIATHADLTVAASPCDAAPVTVYAAGRQLTVSGGHDATVPLRPAAQPAARTPSMRASPRPGGG
jgi:HAD superfamily hydrolase (TIGR01509 family)